MTLASPSIRWQDPKGNLRLRAEAPYDRKNSRNVGLPAYSLARASNGLPTAGRSTPARRAPQYPVRIANNTANGSVRGGEPCHDRKAHRHGSHSTKIREV